MKYRATFVSNSSSTAFIFAWKSDTLSDLLQEVDAHHQFFELYEFDDETGVLLRQSDAQDVIQALRSVMIDGLQLSYNHAKVRSMTDYLVTLQDEVEEWRRMSDEQTEKQHDESLSEGMRMYHEHRSDDLFDHVIHAMDIVSEYEVLLQRGFTSVLEFEFGDNHGEICSYLPDPTDPDYLAARKLKEDSDYPPLVSLETLHHFHQWRSQHDETWNEFAGRVGTLMDYIGRMITINTPSFYVRTEQRR